MAAVQTAESQPSSHMHLQLLWLRTHSSYTLNDILLREKSNNFRMQLI